MTKTAVADVWVTYAAPVGCQCWRDAVCAHGWTWQEGDLTDGSDECRHYEWFGAVHESLADAVRDLFSQEGAEAIGCLLRQRYRDGVHAHMTMTVFVMRAGQGPFIDDHDATDGPTPLVVISRYRLVKRSTPRDDVHEVRKVAALYRPRRGEVPGVKPFGAVQGPQPAVLHPGEVIVPTAWLIGEAAD